MGQEDGFMQARHKEHTEIEVSCLAELLSVAGVGSARIESR